MSRSRLIGLIGFGLAVLLLVVGYWLYPVFFRYLQKQDCIAAGYTSCVQ